MKNLNENVEAAFCSQYSSGKRQFHKAQLEKVNLEKEFLSQIDLRQADLNHANLKDADLSDSDLRESCLIRAELSGTNLRRTNLTGADLSKANLVGADLTKADLKGACLSKSCLTSATLISTALNYANLTGAYLFGVDLARANLKGAFYDEKTSFPVNFDPVRAGMRQGFNLEQLLGQFNGLCQCSNSYLGKTITAKFLHSSRPDFVWLGQLKITESNQIIFNDTFSNDANELQLGYLQQWMNYFVESCSQIIKDFPKMI